VSREIKQKNEGQLVFQWDEERSPGNIILEVELSRHLDSSLIDVDVHPTYVSIIIKNKVRAPPPPSPPLTSVE
jgi:protein TilB